MANIQNTSAIIVVCIMGICTSLRGDQPDIPLPAAVMKILQSNPDTSVFQIDPLKEPRENTNESLGEYRKRLDAFMETEKKGSQKLTKSQKKELITILLNPQNYWHGGICISDLKRLGADIKSGNDSACIYFGFSWIVYIGKDFTGVLNEAGEKAMNQWRDRLHLPDKS